MWVRKNLITVGVFYYIPDYHNLIQQFIWQTEDIVPELPRVHQFLNYWKTDMDTVIQEVIVCYTEQSRIRNIHLHNYSSKN